MQHGQKHPIECSGFHAASLNAVDSMHWEWMQCNPCSVVKCIPIKCSGLHAAWWNEVYSIQCEVMEHYSRQWILCSIKSTAFNHASWNPLHSIGIRWATLHGIHGIHSVSIAACCMDSTASNLNTLPHAACNPLHSMTMHGIDCINRDAFNHAAWNPLHSLGIHLAMLHVMHCV